MNVNMFFKPTPLYKEYKLLDLIEKDSNVTQRELSEAIGASVSMINTYIEDYETKGYLKRDYISNKLVKYLITKKGIERKKLLNIEYLKSSHLIYLSEKENILTFLNQIINKGFKKILLYGAGEVAEILLTVLNDTSIPLDVLAVVDDDEKKKNNLIVNHKVISSNEINAINHDGILISSYSHNEKIYKKLLSMDYNKEKILRFLDIENK